MALPGPAAGQSPCATSLLTRKDMTVYWIAINQSSCALCTIPWPTPPKSWPRPQFYVGFETRRDAECAKDLCITAPIERVRKEMESWAKQGRIVHCTNPDPPARGQPTIWSFY